MAMLFAVCVNGQQVKKSIKASNGVQIGFYEFKPKNYSKVTNQPLIIFLHGVGERGNGTSELPRVARVGIAKLIEKGNPMTFTYKGRTESFVVLSPQLSKRYGAWQPFYIEELIEYAKKNLDIDPDRIFVTGLSLGGGGVWKFASSSTKNASQVAGILPICGTCAMTNPAPIKQADVKVWAFHAMNDTRVGISCTIKAIERINGLQPKTKAKKTYFSSGGHSIWDRVYNPSNKFDGMNVYQWFLSLKKSSSSITSSESATSNPKPAPSGNAAPTAIVSDASITVKYPGDRDVVLNGSGSKDKDGKIVSYEWRRVSGPSAHISYTKMPKTNVSKLTPGTYKFQLTVTDNDGASGKAYVTVKVVKSSTAAADKPKPAALPKNAAPIAEVTDATIVVKYPAQTLTYLNGSRSTDNDGKIVSYLWTQIDGRRAHISYSKMPKTPVSDLVPGVYKFQLTVTDNDGAINRTTVRVTVVNVNREPSAIVSDKSITLKYPRNYTVLNGSASDDPDGKIEKYLWTQVQGRPAHISNTKMPKTDVSSLAPGVYKFQLTVTDNVGAVDKEFVTVNVVR